MALRVKTVRIWFLLLLAVLLPFRSAVAAAMLCPVGGPGVQSELRSGDCTPHHDMGAMSPPEAAHDHGGAGHDAGHDHGAVGKCTMCSAFCAWAPGVGNAPGLPEPAALAGVKFPSFSTPSPSFLSGGQERPPRTL